MPETAPLSTTLSFEARDPSRNLARRYSVVVSRDLFGFTMVDLTWGRIGTSGQHRAHGFQNPEAAAHFLERVLRQRGRAPQRIGVAYQPVLPS